MKTQKQVGQISVQEIMTENVQTLMINDTIKDALSIMVDQELTTIPVINMDERCVGIISRSDVTELLMEEDGELTRMMDMPLSMDHLFRSLETCDIRLVRELMTHTVVTIQRDQTLDEACKLMAREQIHHMPVVDVDRKLVGIISAFDVVKAVAEFE